MKDYQILCFGAGIICLILGTFVLHMRNRMRKELRVRTKITSTTIKGMPGLEVVDEYLPLRAMQIVGILLVLIGILLPVASFFL